MAPFDSHLLPRRSLLVCAGLSLIVFILNLAVTCWAGTLPKTNDGTSILLRGGCRRVSRANVAAHIVLNILSTLLLGASNYSMQMAIAPTRSDVDDAHQKRRWLDIGVPSMRNLKSVVWSRRVFWGLLLLSSLPLHLIYNSSVFASQVVTEYLVTELDQRFLDSGSSTKLPGLTGQTVSESGVRPGTGLPEVREIFDLILAEAPRWDNMSLQDCASTYSEPLLSNHRTLVLVIDPAANPASNATLPGLFRVTGGKTWMCDEPPDVIAPDAVDANGISSFGCNPTTAIFGYRDSDAQWQTPSTPSYCLAEPLVEDCKLEASIPFLVVICVGNIIKVFVMLCMYFYVRGESLNTFGDAIVSFTQNSDPSTIGFSSYDSADLRKAWTSHHEPQPRPWHRHLHRRFHAMSRTRRRISITLFILALSATLALLILGLKADAERGTASLTPSAFFSKDRFAIIGFETLSSASLAGIVLLVNTPQLILSLLYFLCNAFITSLCQAAEWNSYSLRRQPLRVSKASGPAQNGSYWLSIPPRYAIPMLIWAASMHWLISQAIFLSKIRFLDFRGGPSERFGAGGYGNMYGEHPGEMLAAGYGSGAILACLILGAVALLVLLGVSYRRLKGDMVLGTAGWTVGIAAACHGRLSREDSVDDKAPMRVQMDRTERPSGLMWGVVEASTYNDGRRLLGFSDGEVTTPVQGELYT